MYVKKLKKDVFYLLLMVGLCLCPANAVCDIPRDVIQQLGYINVFGANVNALGGTFDGVSAARSAVPQGNDKIAFTYDDKGQLMAYYGKYFPKSEQFNYQKSEISDEKIQKIIDQGGVPLYDYQGKFLAVYGNNHNSEDASSEPGSLTKSKSGILYENLQNIVDQGCIPIYDYQGNLKYIYGKYIYSNGWKPVKMLTEEMGRVLMPWEMPLFDSKGQLIAVYETSVDWWTTGEENQFRESVVVKEDLPTPVDWSSQYAFKDYPNKYPLFIKTPNGKYLTYDPKIWLYIEDGTLDGTWTIIDNMGGTTEIKGPNPEDLLSLGGPIIKDHIWTSFMHPIVK